MFEVCEIQSGDSRETHTAVSYPGGGAGGWAAMGLNLGVSARWRGAHHLEVSVPKGTEAMQARTRLQHFSTVVKVTYRGV